MTFQKLKRSLIRFSLQSPIPRVPSPIRDFVPGRDPEELHRRQGVCSDDDQLPGDRPESVPNRTVQGVLPNWCARSFGGGEVRKYFY